MPTATQNQKIAGLYAAFFNRAPDLNGLNDWNDALNSGSALVDISEQFVAHDVFTSTYAGMSNQEFIEAIYMNMLGAAGDAAGIANWTAQLDAGVSQAQVVADFVESALTVDLDAMLAAGDLTQAEYDVAVDRQATITNRADVGLAFATKLGTDSNVTATGNDVVNDPAYKASIAALDGVNNTAASKTAAEAKLDAAVATGDPIAVLNGDDPGTPNTGDGATFTLTESTNSGAEFEGTDLGDTYNAYLRQNSLVGGVSNSLSSADMLDGKGGTDTLFAELVQEFFGLSGNNQIDIQARTSDIENVTFQARDLANGSVGNGIVTVDAKYMTDIDEIGSINSDGDLVIENLTTLTNTGALRNTESITVTMDHTDNFNSDGDASDLTVYFDEDYLLAGQSTSTSQANYWMLDEDSQDYQVAPLLNIERTGVTLTVDGQAVSLVMDDATADAADTWEAFAAGLQAVIDQMVADGNTLVDGITVAVDPTNTDQTFNDFGDRVTIPAITLTDSQGRDLVPTGFVSPADATGAFDIYGRFDNVAAQVSNDPVTVNVELNKVGREGEGGNLVIGGKELDSNTPATTEGNGITVFNIDVLGDATKPSNLGMVSSTNGALETVNIATATAFAAGDTFASLTIRDGFDNDVEMVNAASFKGDLTLGSDTAVQNLDTLTATGGGKVTFVGNIDGTESAVTNYTTGSNDDSVTVNLDGDAVDTIGESFTVNSAGGDDTVTITMDAGVSQNTMAILDNLAINTSSGDDTVNLDAYGNFQIEAGDGSDFVRINSVDANGNATTGTWNFGQTSGAQNFGSRVLFEAELKVTFAGFEQTVTIETDAAGNYIATQQSINTAIMEAISTNPELSKLLVATPTTGDQGLTVTSTVGGLNDLEVDIYQKQLVATAADVADADTHVSIAGADITSLAQGVIDTTALSSDDLDNGTTINAASLVDKLDDNNVNFYGVAANDLFHGHIGANGESNGIAAGAATYSAFSSGGSSDDTAGINFSTVNAGNGANDLVVFHSNAASANVLEIDNSFGKVSVVNFHDVSPNDVANQTDVGNHAIDFTTFLDNQFDPSASPTGNLQSVQSVAVSLNTDAQLVGSPASTGNAVANSVNMLTFDSNVANTIAFADLTAANLVAALNGDGGATVVGGVDNELDAVAYAGTGELVGSTQKHIVMVENDQNVGEYKVFSLTSTLNDAKTDIVGGNGDFDTASAQLLGTLDFGASINFGLVGEPGWTADVQNLMNAADSLAPVPTYSVSASAGSVDEGQNVTFTLNTTNVADGAVAYSLAGAGIDANDVDQPLNGTMNVVNGVATLTVALAADATTEGAESLTLSVGGTSSTVTVNDTSVDAGGNTPTYALSASAAAANEGETVTFTLNTTNVADGDVAYAISGTGIDTNDITGDSLTGNMTVANGVATLDVALVADATTEGEETLTLTVAGETINLTVNDTSTDGNQGGGDKTDQSIDVGTDNAAETIDAGTAAFNFTDDATAPTNVIIQNFTSDDQISVSNAVDGNYSFTSNGTDYILTFSNNGTVNSITLENVPGADGLVFDEASFEAAIGFDAFLLV